MHQRRPSRAAWILAIPLVLLLLAGITALWMLLPSLLTRHESEPSQASVSHPSSPSPSYETPTLTATRAIPPDLLARTPTSVPTLALLVPQSYPDEVDPLTGLTAADPNLLERRPLAVKVSNFPRYVRQWQSGLSQADHVFEYFTEDLETRFIAVFYGRDAERVGAVRSARFFDEHITRMYHAYLVYSGADDRVDHYFAGTVMKDFRLVPNEYDCPPLCWDNDIADYNNYFLDTSKVNAYLDWIKRDNTRQPLTGLLFTSKPPFNTNIVGRIFVKNSYRSYNYWQFEPASGRYLRFQETTDITEGIEPAYAAHIDNLNGEQVAADNVIILLARYIHNPQSTGEMYVVDLYNSGQAFLFRDGLVYDARWVRTGFDDLLSLTDPGGSPLPLKPGTVFFQVIGYSSTWSSSGTDWFFEFVMP